MRHSAYAAGAARFQPAVWILFLALGSLVPFALLVVGLLVPVAQPVLLGIAGIIALVGLFAYEHCFVVAGQSVPLS